MERPDHSRGDTRQSNSDEATSSIHPIDVFITLPEDGVPDDLRDHPRYRILEVLGTGGMGTVYKAEHRLMNRLVALKVINPGLVGDPAMVARFHQEVRAAACLAHPNIVTAYDADQTGRTHFLVMEYVEGINLGQLPASDEPLPIAAACDYTRQAALGLQHAYERGMVHRDIKPHNLMLILPPHSRTRAHGAGPMLPLSPPWGQVKILDFGLAHFVSENFAVEPPADSTPESGESKPPAGEISMDAKTTVRRVRPIGPTAPGYTILGTADYLAPEEAKNARLADIRADIYSLGCTLYRFLTGQVPFPGGNLFSKLCGHALRDPIPVADLRPDVPPGLIEVIHRMLAKDPGDRYPTPAAVVQALTCGATCSATQILVVDDDANTRANLAKLLEREGYQVSTAGNGQEALDRLRQGPLPRLILLDLNMPVMDGWQFLQEHKRDPALASIPVVVVSGADQRQARAVALGAADYLQKPVMFEELAEKVHHHAVPN